MPIKDKQKAREYFKIYMASKRAKEKSLTVKPNSVKSENGLNPVKPSECSRCEMLENSISKFVNLCYQKEDEVEEQKRKNYQLEKKTKKLTKLSEKTLIIDKKNKLWSFFLFYDLKLKREITK